VALVLSPLCAWSGPRYWIGVDNDVSVRLQGQGDAGERNGQAGHVFVQIKVDKDPFFERDGADVHVKVRSMSTLFGTAFFSSVLPSGPTAHNDRAPRRPVRTVLLCWPSDSNYYSSSCPRGHHLHPDSKGVPLAPMGLHGCVCHVLCAARLLVPRVEWSPFTSAQRSPCGSHADGPACRALLLHAQGEVDLKVPSGSQPGDQLLMRGRGIKKLNSTAFGNQYVHLNVVVPK
jgi:hypothetical protein